MKEDHDPALSASRRAGLLTLANLTGLGLGFLPLGRWKTCVVLTCVSGGLAAWWVLSGWFWIPLVLWILVALASSLGIAARAGLPSYSSRNVVPAWQPLALALHPLLLALATVPLSAGPNQQTNDLISAAVEAGDCDTALAEAEGRSWWMRLASPSARSLDGEAAAACEFLSVALDEAEEDGVRLEAIASHLDGSPVWEGGESLRTELTVLIHSAAIAEAADSGSSSALSKAVAEAENQFGKLEFEVDEAVFAGSLLAGANRPCGLVELSGELAASTSAVFGHAYTVLDVGLDATLLDCVDDLLREQDSRAATQAVERWLERNPDSGHGAFGEDLVGYIELRSVLPRWPDTRGGLAEYCDNPKANPLLKRSDAQGVILLAASALDDPVDAGHEAQTAESAEAVLCADIEWRSGPTCTYVGGTAGVSEVETLQPTLRWDLWDLATGKRIDGGSRDFSSDCPRQITYEGWTTPSQITGSIDHDAVRSILNTALNSHL